MDKKGEKIKILMLGTYDKNLSGHIGYDFTQMPKEYDKRMIVLETFGKKNESSFNVKSSYFYRIYKKTRNYIYAIKRWYKYGERVKIDKNRIEFCFNSFDDKAKTGKAILAKVPDFIPDVISIHWVANFVSPKTIKELYDLTHAHIIIVFVDEAPLAGGCHYHCDCNEWKDVCMECPALKTGKRFAHDQMLARIKYLKDIPMTLVGVKYDMDKAKQSPVYRHADFIESVFNPKILRTEKSGARKHFGIGDDDFVIFIGAYSLVEKRKGFKYAIDAINIFAENKHNITVLTLGHHRLDESLIPKVRIIQPGFLSNDELMKAFCTSDVFLSTTLADSGPIMVNYAFILGVPVVSFDLGIANTIITHRKSGYIADYKNARSVSEGLDYIFNLSSEQREHMSNEAYTTIMSYPENSHWSKEFAKKWYVV